MKLIKKVLFKTLSQRSYLHVLHRGFYFLYNLGYLKGKRSFKYHYLVRELILPEYTVVDIGANLGYFSKTFSKLASKGQVVSIEPVPAFFDILSYFLGKRKNVTLYNVALGTEKGKLEMDMPESDGLIRTGLPHIIRDDAEKGLHKTVEVEIVKGSELLSTLSRIDYIKCDIEGYEWIVFQEIEPLIAKHRPTIQLEIADDNVSLFADYFKRLNYVQYGISNFHVVRDTLPQIEQGDFLFVPHERTEAFDKKFKISQ